MDILIQVKPLEKAPYYNFFGASDKETRRYALAVFTVYLGNLDVLKLNGKQLEKVNELRTLCKNFKI
ncbi:hypothetical protein [Bacillus sp. OK048]|uniref:hypothetical protein n=1 Tax=Bacillus sp. OK048 TaxID=1882761 RepID=UPI00088EB138|nr:hypothetical protein [Bacillus sp. OK048]SDN92011.1 hypothetical protein SAMN05443253_12712 [Bacillus sp. OK048]